MGYTHYYYQNRDFTQDEWQEIQVALQLIKANLPDHTDTAGGYFRDYPLQLADPTGEDTPIIDDDWIGFNGADRPDDLTHEAFVLYRFVEDARQEWHPDGPVFNCCKTARKPYDLAVCAILLAITEIAPGTLSVSSDGDMTGYEWQPARDLIKVIRKLELA